MTGIITAAVIAIVLGLILYLPSFKRNGPKINEVGRIMFAMGLLAWLLNFTKPLL